MSASKNTSNAKSANFAEDAMAIGKENVDAMAKSTAVLTKGMQGISELWVNMVQTSLNNTAVAAQAIIDCGNAGELIEVQGKLAKDGYDKMAAEGRKVSDMSMKLAAEASEPIIERFNHAAEKFSRPLV